MGFFEKEEKYKSISLQIFSKDEVLGVYDRAYGLNFESSTIDFLNFELRLHNYLFEKETWDSSIKFVVSKDGKHFCDFTKPFTAQKNKNLIVVSTGFGKKDPGYWKKGKYECKAYIDEKEQGKITFFIFDQGIPSLKSNPYFTIDKFKFYSKLPNETNPENKKFFSTFKKDDLYDLGIYYQLTALKNKGICPAHIVFHIHKEDGVHKATIRYNFTHFNCEDKSYTYQLHWGNKQNSFWVKGRYIVNVHLMDQLIGKTEFTVGEQAVEFKGENMLTEHALTSDKGLEHTPTTQTLTYEEAKKDLFNLIGLQNVKEEIDELATFTKYLKLRIEKGLEDKKIHPPHIIFTGNPGTGKTTVAKMLGKIYKSLGILSSGHLVEVGRAELIAEFIGQTAPKVKKVIQKARGGVLFVDEAYALARKGESEKDYGREAIEVLMKEMSDGGGDLVMIFAGYPDEMNDFITSNPGIKSRISQTIHFEDYTPKELFEIGLFMANRKNVSLDKEAKVLLQEELYEIYRSRSRNFGNARLIDSIIQEAKMELAKRIMKNENHNQLSQEEISTIKKVDLLPVFTEEQQKTINIPIDEQLLDESLDELNQLIGMDFIKEEIHEVVKLVKYYRKIGKDFRKDFSLHQIFTGNPGTGKTTMARILVKIYKALGILERGHLVEVDRTELVAEYTGQTAPKTNAMIDQSLGGMLFIDEAYSLVIHNDNYGQEVIETLLKRMEDDRGKFTIVAAGYTHEMELFLASNPGLNSRFDRVWHFEDYKVDELVAIAKLMLSSDHLVMNTEAEEYLTTKLIDFVSEKNSSFGNARTVRKIVDEVKKNQLLRMSNMVEEEISKEAVETIIIEDFEDVSSLVIKTKNRNKLGF